MLKIRSSSPTEADLAAVATDYAKLLIAATAAAPIQPNYFAQVASHLVDADTAQFAGKYRDALVNTFVKRQILPKSAVKPLLDFKGAPAVGRALAAATLSTGATRMSLQKVQLSGREFGLAENRPLIVTAPVEQKPFVAVSAALLHQPARQTSDIEQATHRFVKMLFAHHRVDTQTGTKKQVIAGRTRDQIRKTHVLIETPEGPKLVRRLFLCGCRC